MIVFLLMKSLLVGKYGLAQRWKIVKSVLFEEQFRVRIAWAAGTRQVIHNFFKMKESACFKSTISLFIIVLSSNTFLLLSVNIQDSVTPAIINIIFSSILFFAWSLWFQVTSTGSSQPLPYHLLISVWNSESSNIYHCIVLNLWSSCKLFVLQVRVDSFSFQQPI